MIGFVIALALAMLAAEDEYRSSVWQPVEL